MLFFIRDIGSSLMFFGAFLALLYVATNRVVVRGRRVRGVPVGAGSSTTSSRRAGPRRGVAAPVRPAALRQLRAAATSSRSRCSRKPTAGCSGRASASRCSRSAHETTLLPAAQTDLIYAVIVNESACSARRRCFAYLLFVARGFKTATLARDSFSKLLATGLTAVFALQVFVIVGGVTKVIPLTGVTLPFISYGGSSILANFVLLALLLIVSDAPARKPRRMNARSPASTSSSSCCSRCSSRHVVEHGLPRRRAAGQAEEPAPAARAAADPPRRRSATTAASCSRAAGSGDGTYTRTYPKDGLFAHAVGYSYTRYGRAGLERAQRRAERHDERARHDLRPA